jgi:ankyrin repeat protein
MPEKELPARPSLEQYRKQSKDLLHSSQLSEPAALERFAKYLPANKRHQNKFTLTDAQLVIAREHGFESWPKFTRAIELARYQNSPSAQSDPVKAFIEAACVPRDGSSHNAGTLDLAQTILDDHPEVAGANIYTAAILGDAAAVTRFISLNRGNATSKGGPYDWDALTHLCFSRYLRLDKARSAGFFHAAKALLDAGASANTGWFENDHQPHPEFESVIYGAAAVAQNAELTRLLLDCGADPNDAETPYHAAESYDLAAQRVLLESGKLNQDSLTTILLRKADIHDLEGAKLLLAHGADPNRMTRWGYTALHQALRRDNRIEIIDLMLDHGADPTLKNQVDGRSGVAMAARRGRSDALWTFTRRGFPMPVPSDGWEHLIVSVCAATGGAAGAAPFLEQFQHVTTSNFPEHSELRVLRELIAEGGALLAEFAGNGNTRGVQQLLDLGVPVDALYGGDPYFDIARGSTALHVAAWKARPETVKLLIGRGADVNARDGKSRTPLMLAVKACVDSYWTNRRTPESVDDLLKAGASVKDVEYPSGYAEVDALLKRYRENSVVEGKEKDL